MSERAAQIDAILHEHFWPEKMTIAGSAINYSVGGTCRCGMECYDLLWHLATVLDDALAAPCSEPALYPESFAEDVRVSKAYL